MNTYRKVGAYHPEGTPEALDQYLSAVGGTIHRVDDVALNGISALISQPDVAAVTLIQTAADSDAGLFREKTDGKTWANIDVPSGRYIPHAGTVKEALNRGAQIGDWFQSKTDYRFYEILAIRGEGATKEVTRAGSFKFPSLAVAIAFNSGEIQIRDLTEPHAPMWWVFRPEQLGYRQNEFTRPTGLSYVNGSLYVSSDLGTIGLWKFDFANDRLEGAGHVIAPKHILYFDSVIHFEEAIYRDEGFINDGLPSVQVNSVYAVLTDDSIFEGGFERPAIAMGTDNGVVVVKVDGSIIRSLLPDQVNVLHVAGTDLWWSTDSGIYYMSDWDTVVEQFEGEKVSDYANGFLAGDPNFHVYGKADGSELTLKSIGLDLTAKISEHENSGWYDSGTRLVALASGVDGSIIDTNILTVVGDSVIQCIGEIAKSPANVNNDLQWWTGIGENARVEIYHSDEINFGATHQHNIFVLPNGSAGEKNVIEYRGDMTAPGHYELYYTEFGELKLDAIDSASNLVSIHSATGLFVLGQKHGVAVVLESGQLTVYLDGDSIGTVAYDSTFSSADNIVFPFENCRLAYARYSDTAHTSDYILDEYFREAAMFRPHVGTTLNGKVQSIAYDRARQLTHVATDQVSGILNGNYLIKNIDLQGISPENLSVNEAAILINGSEKIYVEVPESSLRDSIEKSRLSDTLIRYLSKLEEGRELISFDAGEYEQYRDEARDAQTNAEHAASIAELMAARAQEYAENPEDRLVTDTVDDYSAKHWAKKSEKSAIASEQSNSEAQLAKSDAEAANTAAQQARTASETSAGESAASAEASANSAATASEAEGAVAQHALDAQSYAISAATSAQNSANSATDSFNSSEKAKQWSEADEDVQVEPGLFSAKHWAAKSAAAATGSLKFRGLWDASTGVYPVDPQLGDFYKVTVAGTVAPWDWAVGDQAIFDGDGWLKIDNTESVTSVAGKTGAISLGILDINDLSTELGKKFDKTGGEVTGDTSITGNLTIQNLTLANPGLGNSSTIEFLKQSDQARITVTEVSNDTTEFEFHMADNPSSAGDKFRWYMRSWQTGSYDWKPLEFYGRDAYIQANNTYFNSNLHIGNEPYTIFNGKPNQINERTKQGDLSIEVDVVGFNQSAHKGYSVEFTDANTFDVYSKNSSLNGPVLRLGAIPLVIGSWIDLDFGVRVRFTGTAAVAGDAYEWGVMPAGKIFIDNNIPIHMKSSTGSNLAIMWMGKDDTFRLGRAGGTTRLYSQNHEMDISDGTTVYQALHTGGGQVVPDMDISNLSSDVVDVTTRISFAGTLELKERANGMFGIDTSYGYINIGPYNTSWAHFETDRPAFWFNKDVAINGNLIGYSAGNSITITDPDGTLYYQGDNTDTRYLRRDTFDVQNVTGTVQFENLVYLNPINDPSALRLRNGSRIEGEDTNGDARGLVTISLSDQAIFGGHGLTFLAHGDEKYPRYSYADGQGGTPEFQFVTTEGGQSIGGLTTFNDVDMTGRLLFTGSGGFTVSNTSSGGEIHIKATSDTGVTDSAFIASASSAVRGVLAYNGSWRVSAESTGIKVFGSDTNNTIGITHDGTNAYIANQTIGNLYIATNVDGGDVVLRGRTDDGTAYEAVQVRSGADVSVSLNYNGQTRVSVDSGHVRFVSSDIWLDHSKNILANTSADGHQLLIGRGADDSTNIGGIGQQAVINSSGIPQWVSASGTENLLTTAGNQNVDGYLSLQGLAQPLILKAGDTADHVYMSFYADSDDQATRSGYVGYPIAGSTTFKIANDMGGSIDLTATSVRVNGNEIWDSNNFDPSTKSDSEHHHDEDYLQLTGGALTGELSVLAGRDGGITLRDGSGVRITDNGDDMVILQGATQIRFGSRAWDYNEWAGIGFDPTTNILYIGGPAGSFFNDNATPPVVDVDVRQGGSGTTLRAENIDADGVISVNGAEVYHVGNLPRSLGTNDVDGLANLTITDFDLRFGFADQVSRGDSGGSRAMVKEVGKLTVNYGNDFGDLKLSAAARIDLISDTYVVGNLHENGSRVWTAETFDPSKKADSSHVHDAGDITSGVLLTSRIPSLSASKITSGTLGFARLPVGTTSTTVAVGNHNHDGKYLDEANNLSDLNNVETARSNLGLGSLATLSALDGGTF